LKGEAKRLALMSELLDPMHRRRIEAIDIVKPAAKTLEVGCGNGSVSARLAECIDPNGQAVAFDLDLSLVNVRAADLSCDRRHHDGLSKLLRPDQSARSSIQRSRSALAVL
jgi:hypothetical protein